MVKQFITTLMGNMVYVHYVFSHPCQIRGKTWGNSQRTWWFPGVVYFHNLLRPDKHGVVMHIMIKCIGNHYNDVTMSEMASQITSISNILFTQYIYCLLNCWSRRGLKKTSKLRVTGLCVGNSPVTVEFPAQKASGKCFHLMTSS